MHFPGRPGEARAPRLRPAAGRGCARERPSPRDQPSPPPGPALPRCLSVRSGLFPGPAVHAAAVLGAGGGEGERLDGSERCTWGREGGGEGRTGASCHFVGSLSLPSLNLPVRRPHCCNRAETPLLRTAGKMQREDGLGWPDPETASQPSAPSFSALCFIPDQPRQKGDVSASSVPGPVPDAVYTPSKYFSAFLCQWTLKFR